MATGYQIPELPLKVDLESREVLKKLTIAHKALAELKGVAASIPNQNILINTLSLQEAKDSSAIENIITTQDDLYQSDAISGKFPSLAAKEVHRYAHALRLGYAQVQQTGLITIRDILTLQEILEENRAGFRKVPGTALKHSQTGEVVYTPPQHPEQIVQHMNNLETFLNDDTLCDWDPLTKMAVIHHQFESIHPFYDGNGRTGRIMNVLYMVKQDLLGSPVLYLSRYINQHKADYYRLLQNVRETGEWHEWLLFLLTAVEATARQTTGLVQAIKQLMQEHKHKIRGELPKIYSQDLINNLFSHPYTKIEYVERDLGVHRLTATKYLEALCRIEILTKHRIGRENFYMNRKLFQLLGSVYDN